MKKISRLHFLTQDHPERSHVTQAEVALRAGAQWIQFRSKEKSLAEKTEVASEIKTLCDEYDAVLIINDSVQLARDLGCGVHLGKTDLPVSQARKILGNECVVGGTANSFDDVRDLARAGADYIGVGPFRFTETKKNLAPILGLDGIRKIVGECERAGIHLPLIAIGGIRISDVLQILDSGVHGLAISSAVNLAPSPEAAAREFLKFFQTEVVS